MLSVSAAEPPSRFVVGMPRASAERGDGRSLAGFRTRSNGLCVGAGRLACRHVYSLVSEREPANCKPTSISPRSGVWFGKDFRSLLETAIKLQRFRSALMAWERERCDPRFFPAASGCASTVGFASAFVLRTARRAAGVSCPGFVVGSSPAGPVRPLGEQIARKMVALSLSLCSGSHEVDAGPYLSIGGGCFRHRVGSITDRIPIFERRRQRESRGVGREARSAGPQAIAEGAILRAPEESLDDPCGLVRDRSIPATGVVAGALSAFPVWTIETYFGRIERLGSRS